MSKEYDIAGRLIRLVNHFRPKPTHLFLSHEDYNALMVKSESRNNLGSLDFGWDEERGGFVFAGALVCSCDGTSHCAAPRSFGEY